MAGFKSAAQLVGESVVKPVTEQFGEAIEEGAQTVGLPIPVKTKPQQNQLDPQKIAQDDAAKKRKVLQNINLFNQQMIQNAQRLKQSKEVEEQKKREEEQKSKEIKQFEFAKQQQKRQTMADAELMRKRTKSERKGGAG